MQTGVFKCLIPVRLGAPRRQTGVSGSPRSARISGGNSGGCHDALWGEWPHISLPREHVPPPKAHLPAAPLTTDQQARHQSQGRNVQAPGSGRWGRGWAPLPTAQKPRGAVSLKLTPGTQPSG